MLHAIFAGLRHSKLSTLTEPHHLELIAWLRKANHIHLSMHVCGAATVWVGAHETWVGLERVDANPYDIATSPQDRCNVKGQPIAHGPITCLVVHSACSLPPRIIIGTSNKKYTESLYE